MCRGARILTLKDLRVAKLDKRLRLTPCAVELEAYLGALGGSRVNPAISRQLSDCMAQQVIHYNHCHP